MFPGTAIANEYKLGDLKQFKCILCKLGNQMFDIQVSAELVPSWGQWVTSVPVFSPTCWHPCCFLAFTGTACNRCICCYIITFPLHVCLYTVFLLCVSGSVSLLIRPRVSQWFATPPYPVGLYFNLHLNCICKDSIVR